MRADLLLLGYCVFCVKEEEITPLFELLRRLSLSPKALIRDEKKGELRIFCSLPQARRLRGAAGGAITLRECGAGGLPVLLCRPMRRPALCLGILLGIALLALGRWFVWDVRVSGCSETEGALILAELEGLGLGKGSFLPQISTDHIELALRKADPEVSYVSVNLRGTVAFVQVQKKQESPKTVAKTPANLVSTSDGVVTMPLVFAGECLVQAGEVVRAGQILVSGLVESENHGFRVMRAAGQILARVEKNYTVSVPFSYAEKSYTGRERYDVTLHFFGKSGKVFKSTGKNIKECDIIEKTQTLRLWGVTLPVSVSVVCMREYEHRDATRTAARATAMAYAELEERLAADSAAQALLERTVELRIDERGVTLICTAVCEQDIARVAEIEFQ